MSRSLSQIREVPPTLDEQIAEVERDFRRVCEQITGHEMAIEKLLTEQAQLFRRREALTLKQGNPGMEDLKRQAATISSAREAKRQAILGTLLGADGKALRTEEIAERCDMTPEATWKALDRLTRRGQVRKVGPSLWKAA